MAREEKIAGTEKLKKMIDESPVIGLIDMFKMPSKQLQEIRRSMRGKANILMTKKALLKLAIKDSNKEKKEELEQLIPLQPAIVFTQLEAFKLYSVIGKLRSPTFAKEGDVVQNEIKVSAGPTSLLPGPAISELSRAGIPAGVEEGKIVVKKSVTVAKRGDVISKELAAALRKLKIEPIEVSLNIAVIYDNGTIYQKDVLDLVKIYPEKIKEIYNSAMNLSINICYPAKENIKFLLAKAFNSTNVITSKVGGVG